jgi:hypothetical protein
MTAARAAVSPRRSAVGDLTLHRMQRALRERLRYRYVQPQVLREGDCFRIQSPCCSRNVDPEGGLIDIALLIPNGPASWSLCSRDHANQAWVAQLRDQRLDTLLEALCVDDARQFWP